jgi:hypothetical protein
MAAAIFDGPWRLLSDNGHTRKWVRQDPDDPNKWIVKTQTYVTAAVAEENAELYKESDGKRFGDGRVVARIPLHQLYTGSLGEAFKAGDTPWLKRFLNDPSNRHLRTFRGNL